MCQCRHMARGTVPRRCAETPRTSQETAVHVDDLFTEVYLHERRARVPCANSSSNCNVPCAAQTLAAAHPPQPLFRAMHIVTTPNLQRPCRLRRSTRTPAARAMTLQPHRQGLLLRPHRQGPLLRRADPLSSAAPPADAAALHLQTRPPSTCRHGRPPPVDAAAAPPADAAALHRAAGGWWGPVDTPLRRQGPSWHEPAVSTTNWAVNLHDCERGHVPALFLGNQFATGPVNRVTAWLAAGTAETVFSQLRPGTPNTAARQLSRAAPSSAYRSAAAAWQTSLEQCVEF